MLEHVTVYVRDYDKSKGFYEQTLVPLGYTLTMDFSEDKTAGFKEGGHTSFWIAEKENIVPTHVAFLAKDTDEVNRFHNAGLAAGGENNGNPGFRTQYGPHYYAAFILDPDGNNIEACYFGETAPGA